ncbi:PLD nuclease N-terminal domain-containing protein [Desulfococcus sp.]|uniref:PLD nuclease N-terminal domain-containing protein n=1 Tax=Desulfococcus sp. TaxID=2025834 RepID=UPI003593BB68
MGIEVRGVFALIILVLDIWAIVSLFRSNATTGKKVLWIVFILILPVIGFILWYIAGPKSGRV